MYVLICIFPFPASIYNNRSTGGAEGIVLVNFILGGFPLRIEVTTLLRGAVLEAVAVRGDVTVVGTGVNSVDCIKRSYGTPARNITESVAVAIWTLTCHKRKINTQS